MIEAKVICDSISPSGVRLTTMELNYPRFIHSEFMTHRMFSRNASSSRAIPVDKMIAAVSSSPAIPVHWGKNQAGMQAREEVEFPTIAEDIWKYGSMRAVDVAYQLKDCELHKQIVNRVLEPFQWIKVIVTATEWDNFFKLRHNEDAQPEIRELADVMKSAMYCSNPVELQPGEWHLPYVITNGGGSLEECIKMSVARCARISFLNHDNSTPNIDKDIALADKLLEAGHMSPLEHQLTPMEAPKDDYNFEKGVTHIDRDGWKWSGNSRGWYQHRQLIGEI